METALANTNIALASTTTALEAQFDDIAAVTSTLENEIIATADKVGANFGYNATLKLEHNGTDYYYSSGFGLKTLLAGSTDASTPSANSEFWVRSDKVKFVDTSNNTVLKGDSQGLTFPSAGSIKSEGYNLATNKGVFIGYNPGNTTANKYELMAGNGTQYIHWNGSKLKVKGDIEGGSININNKFLVDGNGNTSIIGGILEVSYAGVPGSTNYGKLNQAVTGSTVTVYMPLYGNGYLANRVVSRSSSTLVIMGRRDYNLASSNNGVSTTSYLQRSINGSTYTTIDSQTSSITIPNITVAVTVTVYVVGTFGSGSGTGFGSSTVTPKAGMSGVHSFTYVEDLSLLNDSDYVRYKIPNGLVTAFIYN